MLATFQKYVTHQHPKSASLLTVWQRKTSKPTEMKCGKGKRAQNVNLLSELQWVIVTWTFLNSQGKRLMGCTFPGCQHFHWGTNTAARPHLQNFRWAKISIFMAHFRLFSAEEALTLKRSQVLSYGWKHSSCLLHSYYFRLPCIYLQALFQHAQQSSVI